MEEREKPWYSQGLRFQCTNCGDCCAGEPGFVWVSQEELRVLAGCLGLRVEEFENGFTRKIAERFSLLERPNGDCVLFDSEARECTVYSARPSQCRSWPFWDANLQAPGAWARVCAGCPGAGQGHLYSLEEIERERQNRGELAKIHCSPDLIGQ